MFGGGHSHSGGSGGSHSHGGGGSSSSPSVSGCLAYAVFGFGVVGGLIGSEWIGQHVYLALYPGTQISQFGDSGPTGSWGWCLALFGFGLVCAVLGVILLCVAAAAARKGRWLAGGLIVIALAAVLTLIVTPYLAAQANASLSVVNIHAGLPGGA